MVSNTGTGDFYDNNNSTFGDNYTGYYDNYIEYANYEPPEELFIDWTLWGSWFFDFVIFYQQIIKSKIKQYIVFVNYSYRRIRNKKHNAGICNFKKT